MSFHPWANPADAIDGDLNDETRRWVRHIGKDRIGADIPMRETLQRAWRATFPDLSRSVEHDVFLDSPSGPGRSLDADHNPAIP